MAAPTNTLTSVTPQVGAREDLSDVISRVAPEKTPLYSNIGARKSTGTYSEWQTESLAAPSSTNASVEGNDVATVGAANTPTRVGNTCQIHTKSGGVSRTQQVVKLAGRDDELARQKVIKGVEIRRDAEAAICANKSAVAEAGATARQLGGVLAWLSSNVSRGAGGASGGFTASPGPVLATNGTLRNFTEDLLKAVLATAFGNGATPTQAYLGGTLKQKFSAFTGIAQIRKDVPGEGMATIVAAADVYVHDFGNLVLIPHPYAFSRDCLIADPEKLKKSTLDGIKTVPLSKTGDSDKFLMTTELTLECTNEKAHAVVADIQ